MRENQQTGAIKDRWQIEDNIVVSLSHDFEDGLEFGRIEWAEIGFLRPERISTPSSVVTIVSRVDGSGWPGNCNTSSREKGLCNFK
jgi:hypothetical protein